MEDNLVGRIGYIPEGAKYYFDRISGKYMSEEVKITGKKLFGRDGKCVYFPTHNYKRGGYY
jgi:hypothetical protein